ncbi:hypothetical protein FB45DRAFT_986465 [Roridomyces roridus]|uniref:Nucleotidyltransferase n=1 Tax=Roridomyces roridus TaxID=1738132 RepID=A0AAD7CJS6_9AGAR|nr:hypothetical protein FB45DRAFT_986465 [Roridomyces roridus]
MGGSAFASTLSSTAFPRIPPAVYRAVKDRLTPRLETLYSVVSTPFEAPEKQDHGDVDFLVCEPRDARALEVPHAQVQAALNAKYVIPAAGNRTSNYACLVERGEWSKLGYGAEEEARRSAAAQDNQADIYYQVDVHVCTDRAAFERINFHHSYGDLGMILGLISRNKNLAFGVKGLKIPQPPRAPFQLSESMDDIVKYMGLSMERWKAGFETKAEIFQWVATSSLFDPMRFRSEGQGITKVNPERKMYAEFVQWVNEQKEHHDTSCRVLDKDEQVQHALKYFGRKEEFDRLAKEDADRVRLKAAFNGTKVREWTGLTGPQWMELKSIMDRVRQIVGGEPGILDLLEESGEDGLKALVLRTKEELELEQVTEKLKVL